MVKKRIDNLFFIVIFTIMILVTIITVVKTDSFKDGLFEIIDQNNNSASDRISDFEVLYEEQIWKRYDWVNLSGAFSKVCGTRTMYKADNVNVGTNGYIFGPYSKTSTDYEFEQILEFEKYLSNKDIGFIYVNEPVKYINDKETLVQFGQYGYGNQNADKLIQRLNDAGINCLDLRDCVVAEGKDCWDLFYRTDHHWTVPAGLWATKHIVSALNEDMGFEINLESLGNDKFDFQQYDDAWLGEQGRRVAATYIGYDDYTLVEPVGPVKLTLLRNGEIAAQGGFDILLDKSRLDVEADPYAVPSWHYTYLPEGISGSYIINNDIETGRILFLGDSYDQVVVPFLALCVHEVDAYVLRNTDASVRDIVESGDYDAVVMAYAQLNIGAHDNPDNANFRMYDLE